MHLLKNQINAVFAALRGAYPEVQRAEVADEMIVRQGKSFGDLEQDTELGVDKRLGKYFQDQLNACGITRVSIEGFEDLHLDREDGSESWVTVDPLDGSLNFKKRCKSLGLPISSCITLLSKSGPDACFKDIVAGGVIDLRNGDIWFSEIKDGQRVSTLNSRYVKTDSSKKLDLTQQIVIAEFYYPENRERICRAFAGKKGWLRNPGSAAYEMALVANGTAVAYICDRQKQHELGAGLALVLGAGGVAIGFDGKPLLDVGYSFNQQTPVILAANQNIAEQILELLR